MGRLEDYEIDKVLADDELEKREQAALTHKKRRKKRRKRIRRIVILVILILFFLYIFSDYSNIRIVEVNGNNYYSKQQIMEIGDVSLHQKSLLASSFLVKKRLQADPMIKEVSVDKSWDGVMRITIEEEKLIGYYQKGTDYYLMIDKTDDVKIKDVSRLANVPYLSGLNDTQMEEYREQMVKVEKENLSLVSEVLPYETSYDKNMLKLIMQDGHEVRTSISDLKLLNSYTEILKGLRSDLKCIVFAGETNSMYTEKCE